jgi:hypothetical protein
MGRKVTDIKGAARSILEEIEGSEFTDRRLSARFKRLVSQLAENLGAGIPLASEDWANTKAAYRFISNPRVCESEILAGHLNRRERDLLLPASQYLFFMTLQSLALSEERIALLAF